MVYDFIDLNSIFSTRFSILFLIFSIFLRKKIILAPRGMLAASALSLKFYKKNIFITLFRLFRLHELIIWHATDEIEVNDIKNTFGKKCLIKLSPNIPSNTNIKYIPKAKKKNHLDIFFLSRISKKKNLDYALKILNSIPDQYKITFSIIGPIDDYNYWEYCYNSFIKISNHKVEYLGPVKPDIIPDVISSKHLLLLPTLNENYGHVIVESWQNSCPVLISDNTPWTDLEKKRVGFEISLEDHYSFLEKIMYFANMDQIEFNLWSESSYIYSKKIYDNKNLKKLAKLLFK